MIFNVLESLCIRYLCVQLIVCKIGSPIISALNLRKDCCIVFVVVSLQNVPVERLCEIAEAVAKNTHLEKLHLANTRATDKVANVCMTTTTAVLLPLV